jgi:hypothetical protein
MLAQQLLSAARKQVALSPLVEGAMLEPPVAAMLRRLNLSTLCGMLENVHVEMNVLCGLP